MSVKNRKDRIGDEKKTAKLNSIISNYVFKIDTSLSEFKLNVSIALFYEIYKVLNQHLDENIKNKHLIENVIKIMKLMVPFVPHIANECLDLLNCKNKHEWPKIEKNLQNEIKFAVQVNGKTRDIITIDKDLEEKSIKNLVTKKSKASKFIEHKKVLKTIFIKNKIINYIIK